jgi:membrane protein
MPVMITLKQLLGCTRKAVVNTIVHDGIEHAGYLAFLGLLAMFPFLVFMFAIIGFLGQGDAGAAFITSVLQTLPEHITTALN